MGEVIALLFVVIVAPIWLVLHYTTMWKKNRGLTAEDEMGLQKLREAAEKLEGRLKTMERILDDEVPDWRQRHDETR